jgi:hypothetical protein
MTPEEKKKQAELRRMQEEEATERDMLMKLSTLARGFDPITLTQVSTSEMMAAQKQYQDFKHQADQRRYAREKLQHEAELELQRLDTQKELEHRRLDIEADRVSVQKAEVIVKALEVAAQHGVNPEHLLGAIRDLGANLLAGPAKSPLLLDKKESL